VAGYEFVVATSDAEREAAFRLRYTVFVKEVGAFSATASEREVDEFDRDATHFLAKLETEVVGTIRVQVRTAAPAGDPGKRIALPGEEHYDYAPFERDAVPLVEVSRSTVLAAHRGTKVIANLWKIAYNYARHLGATHYVSMTHVGYTDSLLDAGIVYDLLDQNRLLHPRYHLPTRQSGIEAPAPIRPLYSDSERRHPKKLKPPPVMRLFHRFGLRACGRPVFVPRIGRVGLAMLACPETFSASTLQFFHAPDPSHRFG
jgi:putative hemolysin